MAPSEFRLGRHRELDGYALVAERASPSTSSVACETRPTEFVPGAVKSPKAEAQFVVAVGMLRLLDWWNMMNQARMQRRPCGYWR